MSWEQAFHDPLVLPDGRQLRTLRDAGHYIQELPMAAQDRPDVNTSKQIGDPDHIKVFANRDAAETWFAENDPEGVAFEYEVLE
jgi:hypothetical protein